MMPNPWLILFAIMLCIASFFKGIEYQKTIDAAEIGVLNEKSRKVENDLVEQVNQQAIKLKEENEKAKQTFNKLNNDIASGKLRLSFGSIQMPGSATSATGIRSETRCELDPEDAQRIINIPEKGDENTRQLNSLIDWYENAKAQLDKGVKP